MSKYRRLNGMLSAVLSTALLSGCAEAVQPAVTAETAEPSPSAVSRGTPVPSSSPVPSVSPSPAPSASAEAEVLQEETASVSGTFETAADISKSLAKLEKSMDFKEKDDPVTVRHFELSDENLENLKEAMLAMSDQGYDFGFFMEDLNSEKTISFNADQDFYCASSIKAFYVASVLDYNPASYDADRSSMINAVMNSDNEAYAYLRQKYWRDPIRRWCSIAGVDMQIPEEMYPDYSARDVAKLWAVNYWWFDHDDEGKEAASWYESPNMSEIRKLVDADIVTRTKAGWIVYSDSDEYLVATNEGGIIYDGDHPYILVVMSNAPSDFDALGPIMQALMNIHDEMVQEEKTESTAAKG